MLEQLGLAVDHCALTEQIVMDEDNALKHMQAHLADSLNKNCFNRLPHLSGKRLEILDAGNSRSWTPDVSNVRAESILICATHEQNSKLNAAVKAGFWGTPAQHDWLLVTESTSTTAHPSLHRLRDL